MHNGKEYKPEWDVSKGCTHCGAKFAERKVGFTSQIVAYRGKDGLPYCSEDHREIGLVHVQAMA
jgi:hypothetical protein